MTLRLIAFFDALPAGGVDGLSVSGVVARGEERFTVQLHTERFADPIGEIEQPELRAPFQRHVAWLEIAWCERQPVPDFQQLFPPMGSLAAELAMPGISCYYMPYWERFAPADDDTHHAFTTDQPLRGFGILHTQVGCLVHEDGRWRSTFPTRWGPVVIDAHGSAFGPPADAIDRIREIAEKRLRRFRSKLLISLLYRPLRIHLNEAGEISVEFRNAILGSRGHFVSERDV